MLTDSEFATDLGVSRGKGGEILIAAMEQGAERWVEITAVDRGPGIAKLGRALSGGASTKGGLGEGLGAIRRLSDDFEIFAPPTLGTVIVCRIYGSVPQDSLAGETVLGAVCRAKRRQRKCGDVWGFRARSGRSGQSLLLVVDGVGHGEGAQTVADRAMDVLAGCGAESPLELIEELAAASTTP